ncbi:hypothetical protein JXO59_10500 [candidate division KSB1 bacterium]|nr:hypothetical protein [candidate division KSB1 bacterium]
MEVGKYVQVAKALVEAIAMLVPEVTKILLVVQGVVIQFHVLADKVLDNSNL